MSEQALEALATDAGIAVEWLDYRARPQRVAPEVLSLLLTALDLPNATPADIADSRARLAADRDSSAWPAMIVGDVNSGVSLPPAAEALQHLEIELESGARRQLEVLRGEDGRPRLAPLVETGYHRLLVEAPLSPVIAIAPARAVSVADRVKGRRPFGIAVQTYSLQREGDGGIGDFGGLRQFAVAAAAQGADAIAVSPVHALFAGDPNHYAPYSPSSRLLLNVMHADPAGVLGEGEFRAALAATGLSETYAKLEALPLIDYAAAGRAKWQLLRALWDATAVRLSAGNDALSQSFLAFRSAGGERLADHARFEVLHTRQFGADATLWHWQDWPLAYRDARGSAVAEFAEVHAHEVGFHIFAQWLADAGLSAAQAAARAAGMQIGLIADLAVGTDGAGSHAWSRPQELLDRVAIGAPPDALGPEGQNWGLTTFSPRALKAQGFAPFIDLLRANLRHAGGIRIDHVLGLKRLWLAPAGAGPGQGAYLSYPQQDLLRLAALESERHGAVLIGEDLGTVPEGLRHSLEEAGVMGLRVLFFERDHQLFVEPQRWSPHAIATTSTHDLPTVAGWWSGRDLAWRRELKLVEGELAASEGQEREEARQCLWAALAHAQLVSGERPLAEAPAQIVDAACRFAALAPSPLLMLPLEDVLGFDEAPNLPGTTSGHPNWQRRLPVSADALLLDPAVEARLASVQRGRAG